MQFPLRLEFKLLALAPQLRVFDGSGQMIGYVKQKLLKLKESVTVFSDESQTTPIYTMQANRILDLYATYALNDANGRNVANLQRAGWSSIKALFTNSIPHAIEIGGQKTFTVKDEKPMRVLANGLVGEIPGINLITGYFLNPTYTMRREGTGEEVLRIVKQPSFWESAFTVEKIGDIAPHEQEAALLGIMMIVLLERTRG
jgi:uncharacterized protein YxjI